MGILLIIIICIVLYYIIVFSFCKNDDIRAAVSFCGLMFLVPVAIATSQIDNESKFNTFKVKYQYLINTDVNQLDYNGKLTYYQDAQYINNEIIFSPFNWRGSHGIFSSVKESPLFICKYTNNFFINKIF